MPRRINHKATKSKTNTGMIPSFYRPSSKTDEAYMKTAYEQISKLHTASKKSVFILGGDFNAPDVSWKENSITGSKHYQR